MSLYGPILQIDVSTGAMTEVPVDDAWVLANLPERIALTVDKTQIQADGVDTATLTAQLTTPLLTDGSAQPIAESRELEFRVNRDPITVTLNAAGRATRTFSGLTPGRYEIECLTLPGDVVVIEVV